MEKNAIIYLHESKSTGKKYIKCTLKAEGKDFDFCIMPKFLNKKQYAVLMRLLGGNHDNKQAK